MAGIAQAGGVALVLFTDNVETSAEAKDAKYLELLQNVAFKVAICIVTVTSGVVIQNSPMTQLRHGKDYKALSMAYVIAMFLRFSLGSVLLLLSVPRSNAVTMSPTVARRLIMVSLGFVYIAVAIGTVMALLQV